MAAIPRSESNSSGSRVALRLFLSPPTALSDPAVVLLLLLESSVCAVLEAFREGGAGKSTLCTTGHFTRIR
jgi:hypothetical protein